MYVFDLREPMVIVSHYHQAIAGFEGLFTPQNAVPNLLVELLSALIRSGNQCHLIFAVMVEGIFQNFLQFVTVNPLHIREGLGFERRPRIVFAFQVETKVVGVVEDSAVHFLPDNISESDRGYGQPKSGAHFGLIQCGAFLLAHRRQLSIIPNQDQPTALAGKNEFHEVVEQTAELHGGSSGASASFTDHGSFVYDEHGVFKAIRRHSEGRHPIVALSTSVYPAVNGRGCNSSIGLHHFGRSSRGRKQHRPLTKVAQGLHQSTHTRCLARSGVTSNHQGAARLRAIHESADRIHQSSLPVGWSMGEMLRHSVDELFDLRRAANHGCEGKRPNLTNSKKLNAHRICRPRDVS